ncbi:MAG: 30S ribosomal protein S24e [Candidatus Lokiarchaeota archaeon]
MSFEIEILEEKNNPLIDRKEIEFKIENFGEGTPNRMDVKNKLAAMEGANNKLTIIRKLKTHYGDSYIIGKAMIYGNPDDLKFFEPFHIKARNLEKEKRSEVYRLKRKKEPYKHLFEY